MYMCTFNPKWLTEEEHKNYGVRQLQVKGNLWKALFMVCNKTITITAMGESALCKWHGKHQASLRTDATACFDVVNIIVSYKIFEKLLGLHNNIMHVSPCCYIVLTVFQIFCN